MRVYGYQKDSEELIELGEVTFVSNIEGLEKIIEFFQEVKAQHSRVANGTDMCHSHLRDWDFAWKKGTIDIIVATTFCGKGSIETP